MHWHSLALATKAKIPEARNQNPARNHNPRTPQSKVKRARLRLASMARCILPRQVRLRRGGDVVGSGNSRALACTQPKRKPIKNPRSPKPKSSPEPTTPEPSKQSGLAFETSGKPAASCHDKSWVRRRACFGNRPVVFSRGSGRSSAKVKSCDKL